MPNDEIKTDNLRRTVVRICPACGVVNPAGPDKSCPHLHLARFDGVETDLQDLLTDVAAARKTFQDRISALKNRVKTALKDREAEIETPHKTDSVDAEKLEVMVKKSPGALSLESPPLPKSKPRKPRRRPRSKPITVNPRQLELIAREPPKGDA